MRTAALFTWIIAAAGGLYLLAVWLIEYDRDFQRQAATRLPVPVISAHALLATVGLTVWVMNFFIAQHRLVWVDVAILAVVAVLGLSMAFRWLGVYRANPARAGPAGHPPLPRPGTPIPAERNFPLPVVIAHGVFAVITVILVLLTALRVGVS